MTNNEVIKVKDSNDNLYNVISYITYTRYDFSGFGDSNGTRKIDKPTKNYKLEDNTPLNYDSNNRTFTPQYTDDARIFIEI